MPGQALALLGDQIEIFGAETITYDSNVFRISSGVDPNTTINSSKRSDWSSLTQAGVNLNMPVGRQRIQAGFSYNFWRYDRFKQLDFEGYDARALWLWQLRGRRPQAA